ncbi:ComEC/Rec2 family competence protein [Cellulomonas edaphi]|uniref:ComEC/Rec2 family competence protein n=1 Tax=Cellulomonas edaphi TaxID=3053468 RepID=A0ABT7S7H8_9CELL|nr:ComEC/Rec2 family competence protein [Cellulomons edaphi]MDM7831567.1 ComEC/Rec2 family competence protein [Cellulomons edaphi]
MSGAAHQVPGRAAPVSAATVEARASAANVDAADSRTVIDLRLAPALAAAWLAALLVVRLPAAGAAAAGGAALAAACGAAAAAGVPRRRLGADPVARRGAPPERRAAPLLRSGAFALVVAALVLAAGAAQLASRDSGPWRRLVGEPVTLVGRVAGDPVLLPPSWPGAPEQAAWLLTVQEVGTAHARQRARAPVRVIGPAARLPPFDARVRVAGVLRAERPGARAVAVLLSADDPVVVGRPPPWQRAALGVRASEHRLAAASTGDARALLPGVTVGDTTAVPDDLRAAMRAAGLTHLTAVSGAHFSLVAMLAVTLAGWLRVPRRWRPTLVVGAMVGMVVLVHPSASVVRAAAMGLVGVWGMLLGRPARAPAALAAAVVVLLVADPWLAGEVGFVLSVVATGAIVLVGGPLTERWAPRLGRVPAAALAVPVAAQLACGPVIAALTPSFSTYAVVANVVAAPAVAPATLLGLAAGVLETWWPSPAQPLGWAAGAACWWIGKVARVAAGAPGATVAWLPGATGVVVLGVAGLCVLRLLMPRAEPPQTSAPVEPAGRDAGQAAGGRW